MFVSPQTVYHQLDSSLNDAPAPIVRETAPTYEISDTDVDIPDAATVHRLLMSLKALGNEVRLALLDALVTLHDGRLCIELGYSGFYQYCDREMGLGRSTAYEYLRAGKALLVLPRLRTLFKEGELSWQQVRDITRVAKASTEEAWIKFAVAASAQELKAEVAQAKRAGRRLPRDRRHGLPNLLVRLSFDLTLEEKERLRAALAQVREALDEGSDAEGDEARGPGSGADGRPVLVRWSDGILSGAIPSGPPASGAGDGPGARANGASSTPRRPTPAQTILYRSCPECHKATVDTEAGPVAVSPERIAELAPHSQRVTITPDDDVVAENLPIGEADAPNSAALARKVIHRDGLVCQNPACGSRTRLQAHHIVFRSAGGPTAPSNEVTVCDRCHALIHAGLLEVTGHSDSPKWTPRPLAAGVKVRDAEALARRVDEMTAAIPTPPPAAPATAGSTAESTAVDSGPRVHSRPLGPPIPGSRRKSMAVDSRSRVEDLAEGLVRLRYPRHEAKGLVAKAMAALAQEGNPEPTDEDILRRAFNMQASGRDP